MIICAAIMRDWMIIRWHRHSDCIRTAVDNEWRVKPIYTREMWFINSNWIFVGRKEAYQEAVSCGQIMYDSKRIDGQLYSEDLY